MAATPHYTSCPRRRRVSRRYEPIPRYVYEDADPRQRMPRRPSAFESMFYGAALVFVLVALVSFFFDWRSLAPAAQPAPTVQRAVQGVPQSAPAALDAPAQVATPLPIAPVAPLEPVAQVAVSADALPTAAVAVANPAALVVVQPGTQARIAADSIVPSATIAPTVATTAFMQLGTDFTASADGTCVRTHRNGDLVEFCQQRPMNLGEMSSVADYLRTGMITGTVVPE